MAVVVNPESGELGLNERVDDGEEVGPAAEDGELELGIELNVEDTDNEGLDDVGVRAIAVFDELRVLNEIIPDEGNVLELAVKEDTVLEIADELEVELRVDVEKSVGFVIEELEALDEIEELEPMVFEVLILVLGTINEL